jgi:hypothetical protein
VTILRVARVTKLAQAITGIPNGTTYLLTPPLHIGRAIKRAHEAVNQVRAQVTKKGLFQSGARLIQSIEAARNKFGAGIQTLAW